jgi:AraC-like DNA-binding protein
MKARLHKLPLISDSSFLFNKWEGNYFNIPWHFHQEYELVLIDKSKGTKLIGDTVSLFEEGDLLLIGANIPHLFRNNEDYYTNDFLKASSIDIHFTEDFLGKFFFDLPEMTLVKRLLDHSSFALVAHGKTRDQITKKLYEMCGENPTQRLMSLLEILIKLSESKELNPLLSTRFVPNNATSSKDSDRIHKVFDFIMNNYTQKIYMSQLASMLSMSASSFSKYFKCHTRKTFSSYITDIRINLACRLLIEGEKTISQIGYLSGFENLSNFHRHFKEITGLTPKDYQSRFLKIKDNI